MTRFTASGLDLSTLNPASLFPVITFEGIIAARMADLQSRLVAAGWPYDVTALQTDPGAYIQQTSAYRELLTQQSINSAVLNVLLAFAQGEFLDQLGLNQQTVRLTGELDSRYRARIQLAPEAYSATGTPGGYIYYATGADLRVLDCGVAVVNRGLPSVTVVLSIMSTEPGGVPSQPVINNVYNAIYAPDVKLLTDTIAVNAAVAVPFTVNAILNLLPGPDPGTIIAAAQIALTQTLASYQRLSLGVPMSAITSALSVQGVDSVKLISPASDIITAYNQFGILSGTPIITTNLLDSPFPATEVGSYQT